STTPTTIFKAVLPPQERNQGARSRRLDDSLRRRREKPPPAKHRDQLAGVLVEKSPGRMHHVVVRFASRLVEVDEVPARESRIDRSGVRPPSIGGERKKHDRNAASLGFDHQSPRLVTAQFIRERIVCAIVPAPETARRAIDRQMPQHREMCARREPRWRREVLRQKGWITGVVRERLSQIAA